MKDIIRLSLEESFDYLEKLRIREVIQRKVLHLLELEEKGVSTYISFPSRGKRDYYQFLIDRFKLIDIPLSEVDFSNSYLYDDLYKHLKEKIQHNEAEYRKKRKRIRMVKTQQERIHNSLSQGYLNSEEFRRVNGIISASLNQEYESYKEQENKQYRQLSLLKDIKNRRTELRSTFRYYENEFALLVLSNYMNNIQNYLKRIFPKSKVIVRYNKETWTGKFEEGWSSYYPKSKYDSIYETQLKNTLINNKDLFSFKIVRKGNVLSVRGDEVSFYLNKDKASSKESVNLQRAKNRLEEFYNNNESFYLILRTISEARDLVSEESTTCQLLTQVLVENYGEDRIEYYNNLVREVQLLEAEHEKDIPVSKANELNLGNLQKLFPDVTFDIGKEKDWIFKQFLNEDRHRNVLYSLNNDKYKYQTKT